VALMSSRYYCKRCYSSRSALADCAYTKLKPSVVLSMKMQQSSSREMFQHDCHVVIVIHSDGRLYSPSRMILENVGSERCLARDTKLGRRASYGMYLDSNGARWLSDRARPQLLEWTCSAKSGKLKFKTTIR